MVNGVFAVKIKDLDEGIIKLQRVRAKLIEAGEAWGELGVEWGED